MPWPYVAPQYRLIAMIASLLGVFGGFSAPLWDHGSRVASGLGLLGGLISLWMLANLWASAKEDREMQEGFGALNVYDQGGS